MQVTTGKSLKLQRIASDVKAKDVAAAAGIHYSWVSRIEKLAIVPAAKAKRYQDALAACVASATKVRAA